MDKPAFIEADYFDGYQASAQRVRLHIDGGELHIVGATLARSERLRQVRWPERAGAGMRQAYLPGHGLLVCADGLAWDTWTRAHGLVQPWLLPWLRSWRGLLLTTLAVLALLVGVWRWGLPAAASGAVALMPLAWDQRLGEAGYQQLQSEMLLPSALPAARQQALRQRFAQALTRWPGGAPPAYRLSFHAAKPDTLGPNALALPGGQIVVTDALVALLHDREEVLIGVLGHELGHVQHRHGMRAMVQAGALAALASWLLGDVSSVLAAAPVMLGQAAYSRAAEFEADAEAARLLKANGISPRVMTVLFDRLQAQRRAQARRAGASAPEPDSDDPGLLGISLASHPPDAERVRRMVEVAGP